VASSRGGPTGSGRGEAEVGTGARLAALPETAYHPDQRRREEYSMKGQSFEVGSRARFGVSLRTYPEFEAGLFAEVILWLLDRPLGQRDDPTAVYAFVCALEEMIRIRRDDTVVDLLHLPAADAWLRVEAEEDRFKSPSLEFFDDYEIYCVGDEQSVRFLWKSRAEQDGHVNDAALRRAEVDPVVRQLRAVYEDLAPS
jgi:hypothetical protein